MRTSGKQAQHTQPGRIGEQAKERADAQPDHGLKRADDEEARRGRPARSRRAENDASVHHEHVWFVGAPIEERLTDLVIVGARTGNKDGRRDDHGRKSLQITQLAQPGRLCGPVTGEQLAKTLRSALALIANRALNLRKGPAR